MAEKIRRRTDRFHKQRQRKRLGIIRRHWQKRRIGERKTDWDLWQTQQTRCVVEHSVTELGLLKQKRYISEYTQNWTLQADTYSLLVSTDTELGPIQTDTEKT